MLDVCTLERCPPPAARPACGRRMATGAKRVGRVRADASVMEVIVNLVDLVDQTGLIPRCLGEPGRMSQPVVVGRVNTSAASQAAGIGNPLAFVVETAGSVSPVQLLHPEGHASLEQAAALGRHALHHPAQPGHFLAFFGTVPMALAPVDPFWRSQCQVPARAGRDPGPVGDSAVLGDHQGERLGGTPLGTCPDARSAQAAARSPLA